MNRGIVFLAIGGGLALRAFFLALRTNWPVTYFGLGFSPAIDPVARRSMVRYLVLRAGPVFLAATFVGVTAARWKERPLTAVAVMLGVHLLTTYGVGLARAAMARKLATRIAIFWMTSSVLAILAGLAAVPFTKTLAPLVPSPGDMASAVWTSVFAAAVAIAALRVVSGNTSADVNDLIDRSAAEVPKDLEAYAAAKGAEFFADLDTVRAVILVENIQRPAWLRRLERLKGKFFKAGTYGIMQVASPAPITDRQSIDIAIEKYFYATAKWPTEEYWTHEMRIRGQLEAYNSNPNFLDMVMHARSR